MQNGSHVHYHKDQNDCGTYHVRFNVMIQNADIGGTSVYNNIAQSCKERQYILCRSGLDYHYCSKIRSEKPRYTISFGFKIPKEDISKYPHIFGDII